MKTVSIPASAVCVGDRLVLPYSSNKTGRVIATVTMIREEEHPRAYGHEPGERLEIFVELPRGGGGRFITVGKTDGVKTVSR